MKPELNWQNNKQTNTMSKGVYSREVNTNLYWLTQQLGLRPVPLSNPFKSLSLNES